MIICSVIFLLIGLSFHFEGVSQSFLQEFEFVEFGILSFLWFLYFFVLVRFLKICGLVVFF